MSNFAYAIRFGIAAFPLAAVLAALPYFAREYRRLGAVSLWKTLVFFSFVLYISVCYYLVVLPLPETRDAVVASAAEPQLVPLTQLRSMLAVWRRSGASLDEPLSWMAVLRSPAVYMVVFNFIFFMPLGAYLRYYFHRGWWQATALGFAVSLFFEVTQLTGLYGIYAHPYRLFDVDDLVVNTLGCLTGWAAARPACALLPDLRRLDRASFARGAGTTSLARRALAFAVDGGLVVGVCGLLYLLARYRPERFAALMPGIGIERAVLGVTGGQASEVTVVLLCAATAASMAVWGAVPLVTHGCTPGQALFGLRVVRADGRRASWYQRLGRYTLLVGVEMLLPAWLYALYPGTAEGATVEQVHELVVAYYALLAASVAARAAVEAATRGRRPFYLLAGAVTDTRVMSVSQTDAFARRRAARAAAARWEDAGQAS